jgi:cytochrome c
MMEAVIPRDLPLPLPAPWWLLVGLLLLSFALHILFVNLMLGGSLLALFTEIRGLGKKDWDRISHEIAKTITVSKSMAVVLGVAPLLTISVLYTVQFYSANILTGHTWMLVIPLVILAFLLAYAHKYSWETLAESKGLHISLGAASTGIFLFIPLIFLVQVNLMLYPERWRQIGSFWDALLIPNVLPRYFHFLAATVALAALFFAWYFSRRAFFEKLQTETLTREQVMRVFYGVALGATGAQFIFGPLLFLTLPAHVVSTTLVVLLGIVILLAAIVIGWLWQERLELAGRRLWPVVGMLTLVVTLMIWARHEIRETAVVPHRALVAARTAEYEALVLQAHSYLVMPGGMAAGTAEAGAVSFNRRCASCHALDRKLVGPPITESVQFYKGNPQGIVDWVLRPGRRRNDYPPMPPQALPRDELQQIAAYMLSAAEGR